ncbi:MAG TPA: hypothetical protein VFR70_03770 [Flavobacterium sp.]|nr:hypothetical protein [Flavobacterium sp.]
MEQALRTIKAYCIISLICICNLSFGSNSKKAETDTIANWQLHKDSKLILKSNISDPHRYTVKIKASEAFHSLSLSLFYDFNNEIINRKIELICNKKIITQIADKENSRKPFKIQKGKIRNVLDANLGKDIYIKYTDKFNPNVIIIGIVVFV